MLLLMLVVTPAIPAVRELVARWRARRELVPFFVSLWLLPYLVYATGTGDFRWRSVGRLLPIAVPPVLVYAAVPVRNLSKWAWQDAIAWSWLVLIVVLRQMSGIWSVP